MLPRALEPAPFCAAALEALDIWQMMGCELRIEALPVVLAMHPECDPEVVVTLLQVVAQTIRDNPPRSKE